LLPCLARFSLIHGYQDSKEEFKMRYIHKRRAALEVRAAEKSSKAEQMTVLILGAMALLGFLLT
jgi:hypothetical protein